MKAVKPVSRRQRFQDLFRAEVLLRRVLLHLAQGADLSMGRNLYNARTMSAAHVTVRLQQVLKEQQSV